MVDRTAPRPGCRFMLVLLGGLWFLELLDQLSGNQLDQYGIHARLACRRSSPRPFLHAGWDHLISNSLPFLVLDFWCCSAASPDGWSPR